MGFDPWVGKILWKESGNSLQYSCLENPHGQRIFEGNPVAEGTTRRGTATPVHRPQRPAGSTPMPETRVQSLGGEDSLEKEMVTHSSILAWRIQWMKEPGRL